MVAGKRREVLDESNENTPLAKGNSTGQRAIKEEKNCPKTK